MLDNLNLEPSNVGDEGEELDNIEQSELDEHEEAAEEIEGEESEVEVFQVGGKEYTVEDIEELEKGSLRQSDYTKKTMALAEDHRTVKARLTELDDSIGALESLLDIDESALDDLLEDGDTEEYASQQKLIKQRRKQIEAAKAKRLGAQADLQARESQLLVDSLPEWGDPADGEKTKKADIDAAMKYAESIGHTNETLSNISDHRILRSLIDAGRAMQAKELVSKGNKPANKRTVSRKKPAAKKAKTPAQIFYGT